MKTINYLLCLFGLVTPAQAIARIGQLEPVRYGRWIFGELGPVGCDVNCSQCGWGAKNVDPVMWLDYDGHKHCGCCGAKMAALRNDDVPLPEPPKEGSNEQH